MLTRKYDEAKQDQTVTLKMEPGIEVGEEEN